MSPPDQPPAFAMSAIAEYARGADRSCARQRFLSL
jgi:hypothetical protein